MKKILVMLCMVCALIFPSTATAVDLNSEACQGITDSAVCKDASAGRTDNPLFGPNGALTRVISVLSMVLAVIAVIVLIIAGIRFAVSQGNSQSVGNVRNTVIYAMVGLVVAALSQALVQLVLTKLP